MSNPLADYQRRVAHGEIEFDDTQQLAVKVLDRLHFDLLRRGRPPRAWRRELSRIVGRESKPPRGAYLWGDVGRGKTYLMDLFYHSLPFEDKVRQHFHRFMASTHERLKRLRDRADPLDHVAKELAAQTRIICFDEFAVTDIADAMILGNLFASLFSRGVALAATSNTAPVDLYRDGLQRQQFLPAIALIEAHTQLVHVGGGQDYRLRLLERADVYQNPHGEAADSRLAEYFESMVPEARSNRGRIEVLGRTIEYRRCADGVIWFDFAAVCDGPRSQDDYIELSRCYHTVLLSGVPRFDRTRENQARRFIALVDEFYDRRVKLILSAETELGRLYRGSKLAAEFRRTRSRLEEMQTHDYLAAAHRP